ncbi:MAG: N-acetyltransferase [Chloroflexi bacterium]|nr:N-acetyltransferase [Chloroflexota bacterium]
MAFDAAFTHFPRLTTDRLLLREIQPGDAEAIFAIFSDEEAMEFYGHPPHQSLDDTHGLISQIQTRYAKREGIRWGITLKDDDRVIGSCGLRKFDDGRHHAETGYELHREFWGQGLMAEAMVAILTYGFVEMGLHRVEAIIDDANTRSKSLLLKLGFSHEGTLRERYYFDGHFEHEYYYGLLKHEWERRV